MDLVAVVIVSLIVTILAILGEGALQIVLGLFFALFFPGYTLIAALFPKNDDLERVQRIALSFGLSIAVVPLIGLIVNYTPWGINLFTVLLAIFAFIMIAAAIAWIRRRKLPAEQRFQVQFKNMASWLTTGWKEQNKWDRAIRILLISTIAGMIGVLVYMVQTPQIKGEYTEFYILGPEGKAENYPRDLKLGETAEVLLVIANHEFKEIEYRVRITIDDDELSEIGPIHLLHEEKWEQYLTIMAHNAGENQKVTFQLYKGADKEPSQSLYFWINVLKKN
ncbi:MAG: DUF1616 domain-containing protein [Desulfobacteraceae bacterium]|nr:DUF1616 domain-containing protein [Desulfobacteraceae bacterium]